MAFPIYFLYLFVSWAVHHKLMASPAYVYSLCPDMITLALSNQYQTNLITLLCSLLSNATNDNRFYNTTAGSGANKVYSFFFRLYHGTATVCQDCIALAIKELRVRCSDKKASTVWYDQCMIRYSNVLFFGNMDTNPILPMWNRPDACDLWSITSNNTAFTWVFLYTLRDDAIRTANGQSGKKFVTKEAIFEANLSNLSTIYTFAECTPDISVNDCRRCLMMSAVNESDLCNQKAGCTLMCHSYNLRYKVYPFKGDGATTFSIKRVSKQVKKRKAALVVGTTVAAALALSILFGV